MAETSVSEDLSVVFELGEGLDEAEQRQELEKRAPEDGWGVLRTQEGAPAELILIVDEAEAGAVVEGGNVSNAQYSKERVFRGSAEFLVTTGGMHYAITKYKREG